MVRALRLGDVVPHGPGGNLLAIALCLCFAAIVTFVIAVSAARGAPTLADEIAKYGTAPAAGRGGGGRNLLVRGLLLVSLRAVESGSFEERIGRDLDRAGMRLRPHEWVLIRCCLGAGLVIGVFVLTGNLLLGLLVGVLGGWAGPRILLSGKISRRLNAFADQLPDALQLIASSLRSGFTVSQSLDRLAQQDIQPLGGEISRAVARTRLGVGVEDALDGVAERMDCRDLAWVVMAIRIQRDVGGNLADVIETTVATMRERTHLRRHVRALSAEGRLSAYILIAMPLLVIAALTVLRPAYVRILFTDPIGILMLVGAGISMTVGWLWMRSIIRVEA